MLTAHEIISLESSNYLLFLPALGGELGGGEMCDHVFWLRFKKGEKECDLCNKAA